MSEAFETMTRGRVGIYTIRVWRESDGFQCGDDECQRALLAIDAKTPEEIFEALRQLPRLSACEITTASGQGAVYYREWP
jgi:hypothetical protein